MEHPPPGQDQDYLGRSGEMNPRPRDEMRGYEGKDLLARACADHGGIRVGAVAIAFAEVRCLIA